MATEHAANRDTAARDTAVRDTAVRDTAVRDTAAPVKRSAGILLFRRSTAGLEVLLAHPGGPFWANKDLAAWSVPKGEYGDDETAFDAARREFTEELGLPVPPGEPIALGEVTQRNRKLVTVWAIEADLDPAAIVAGTFEMVWPPRSGRRIVIPEIDRVAWFSPVEAAPRLISAQQAFLGRLETALDQPREGGADEA